MSKGLSNLVAAGATDGNVIYEGPQAEVERLAATYGLTVRKKLPGGAVLGGSAGKIDRLAKDRQVAYLSEDATVTGMMAVATQSTGANQLWQDSTGGAGKFFSGLTGSGIGVAIVDSGIADHPDVRNRILYARDFTGTGTGDGYGHGTHVASIIAGSGAGSLTRAGSSHVGMAPGASLISLKVLGNDGTGYVSDVIRAIEWTIANKEEFGIRVMNLSLGHPSAGSSKDDPMAKAAAASGTVMLPAPCSIRPYPFSGYAVYCSANFACGSRLRWRAPSTIPRTITLAAMPVTRDVAMPP